MQSEKANKKQKASLQEQQNQGMVAAITDAMSAQMSQQTGGQQPSQAAVDQQKALAQAMAAQQQLLARQQSNQNSRTPGVGFCYAFAKGKCSRTDCKFKHELPPTNPGPPAGPPPSMPSGVDICRDFSKGRCKRFGTCHFAHVPLVGN
jgi:hypothetical protein